jgi:hypothetical protein
MRMSKFGVANEIRVLKENLFKISMSSWGKSAIMNADNG